MFSREHHRQPRYSFLSLWLPSSYSYKYKYESAMWRYLAAVWASLIIITVISIILISVFVSASQVREPRGGQTSTRISSTIIFMCVSVSGSCPCPPVHHPPSSSCLCLQELPYPPAYRPQSSSCLSMSPGAALSTCISSTIIFISIYVSRSCPIHLYIIHHHLHVCL